MVNSEVEFFYKENLIFFFLKIVCFFINFPLIHLTVCSSLYNPSEQADEYISEAQFKIENLWKTSSLF